ncbi:membrane protein [Sporosarcina sp. NCCP-2716]|uniref:MBL fold metallo-hydrolase n=1 Tax=Sporosarcina sp. NCCP-2716 TaxID=2943679 RepID=UPI00203B26B2|nr:MBL fold metallo-hydrolase [Sporosarcina sp. NCCP-2716]GKV70608.1 membrane protein [Sporosarcina sp. NCCP-2716]
MVKRRYRNMDPDARPATFGELMRWRRERARKKKDMRFKIGQAREKKPDYLLQNRSDFTLTWIGHSTFLIQMDGLTIITDPVFAGRMGLDRRLEKPGLMLAELPPVDVVLLSHSHYDHMDAGSLRRLKGNPILLVPDGLGPKVRKLMKRNTVHEVSWGGHVRIGPLTFHSVPAQHWTKRSLTDTNTSHWCGWVIQPAVGNAGRTVTVYFAGDSGYFGGFRGIGDQFPDIRYALLPIGAYEPEWFMGAQHMTPEEAIRAFSDVKGRVFVPMHYGAYHLADDTTEEALDRLLAEWRRRGFGPERLRLFKHGETLIETME